MPPIACFTPELSGRDLTFVVLLARLLQTLDIRKNEFKALPNPLEYYTNLRKLNVSHNHLVNLGGVLRNCELLEEIWAQARFVLCAVCLTSEVI